MLGLFTLIAVCIGVAAGLAGAGVGIAAAVEADKQAEQQAKMVEKDQTRRLLRERAINHRQQNELYANMAKGYSEAYIKNFKNERELKLVKQGHAARVPYTKVAQADATQKKTAAVFSQFHGALPKRQNGKPVIS